ncbi:hypothetical protein V1478_003450 [Vespula squamosa]|uniref:Uncharacterized protein n=1 Tax=Vespula squamosa TaxID=30214 RepID=A0ABD2BLU0_VESSQ
MFPKRSQCEEADLYRDHSGEMKADRSRDLYLERCSYKKERLCWDLLGKAGVDFAFSSLLFLFACVPSASTVKGGRQVDVPTVFQSSREYEGGPPIDVVDRISPLKLDGSIELSCSRSRTRLKRRIHTLTRCTRHVARGDSLSGSDLSGDSGGTCPRHGISLRICRWRESDHDISITRALLQPSCRARVGGVNSVELSISQ